MRLFILACFLFAPIAGAQDLEQSKTVQLANFLTNHVLGERFASEVGTGTSEDGLYDFEFQKTTSLTNLGLYEGGVAFTLHSIIKQKNTRKKDIKVFNRDRVSVLRCELGERKSTGKMLGFCRTEVAGLGSSIGEFYTVEVAEMTANKLVLKKREGFYSDAQPGDGEAIAVNNRSKVTISVPEGGKPDIHEQLSVVAVQFTDGRKDKPVLEDFEIQMHLVTEEE